MLRHMRREHSDDESEIISEIQSDARDINTMIVKTEAASEF